MKQNSILRMGLILCVICAAAGLVLGLANFLTKEPIAQKIETVNQEALASVMNDASKPLTEIKVEPFTPSKQNFSGGTDSIEAVYENEDGYAIKAVGAGYAGAPMEMTIGISKDGIVTGISIIKHSESPGLGANAKEPEFLDQFTGKSTDEPLIVTKMGASSNNEIDAITAATRTTNGVVSTVNTVFEYFNTFLKEAK